MQMLTEVRRRVRPRKVAASAMPASSARSWRAWARDPWTWVVALSAALVVFMSLAGITQPVDRDEGAFLTIAYEVLHGRIPYRDAFDQKGPGIYYFLVAVLSLTGPLGKIGQIFVARAVVALLNLATAAGLIVLGRRWWRFEVGALAALLWLFALPLYGGDQFFTEPFAVVFTVWALVIAARWPGARGAFAAGVMLTLGSIFKQTAVLALPGLAIIVVAASSAQMPWWRPTRARIAGLSALIGGVIAPWLVVMGLFAAAGALGPMVDQVVVYNVAHYPPSAPAAIRASMRDATRLFQVLWITPVVVVGAGLWRWVRGVGGVRRAPGSGALASLVIGVLNLLPFKSHAYTHYWIQVVPWAALLTALGLLAVLDVWRSRSADRARQDGRGPRGLLAAALIMLVIVLTSGRSITGAEARAAYPKLRSQVQVAAWIAQYAPPGTRLLVAPAEPHYYFLADRLPVTSYVYLLPINLTPSLLAQLTDEVSAEQFDEVVWFEGGGGNGYVPPFAGLYQALKEHYHVVATDAANHIDIFVANTALGQSSALTRRDRSTHGQSARLGSIALTR
jgi:hypothetical protein